MGTRGCMSNVRGMVMLRVMLAMVMVSQFQLAACQGFSNANSTTGKVLDPNNTMNQLQKLVSTIDTTQDYYPGLVASQKWQDPLENITILGRVLLWTPDCSMEARDGEYTLSGLLISGNISHIFNTSKYFHTMIDEGPSWAMWIQDNLWLDYFPTTQNDSSENNSKSYSFILPSAKGMLDSISTGSNNTSNFEGSGKGCVPYDDHEVIDSLISDTNEFWNILYPRQFVMSTNRKYFVEMQLDCNLVVYTFPKRKALWASNTFLAGVNCTAVMQSDGNMVVYNGSGTSLWSSKSYIQNYVGSFRFTIQKDGLAVVYNMESGQILWASYRSGL